MGEEVELCVEIGSNMNEPWVEKANINELCRACANTHANMIPIFEGDGLEHDLKAKIDKHFPVTISKNDGLPHRMCFQCASTLVAWHDMFTGCIDAEKKLKNLLKISKEDSKVVEEALESSVSAHGDLATEKLKLEQNISVEMDVEDGDDDDDDDDDDHHDDDEEEDAEEDEIESEEVVLHKLDGKKKENAVEIGDKETTIRDQIMVMSDDKERMKSMSMVLHFNKNDKTLELSSNFPASSNFKENASIVNEVVKYVRQKYDLDDNELLVIKLKSNGNKMTDFLRNFSENLMNGSGNEMTDGLRNDDVNAINNIGWNVTASNNDSARLKVLSFYCKACDLRYRHLVNFEAHMKTHQPINEESNQNTSSTDGLGDTNLKLEEPSCDEKGHLHCNFCKKFFISRRGLKNHINSHVVRECDVCGKVFNKQNALNEHKSIHTGERPYICQVCGKTWRTYGSLYSHLTVHMDKRPYVCKVCHKAFKLACQLSKHSQIHGERNLVCEVCGRKFAVGCDFRRHLLTHNGLKPYKCYICSSKFNQKRYLKNHMVAKHRMVSEEVTEILRGFKIEDPANVVVSTEEDETDEQLKVENTS